MDIANNDFVSILLRLEPEVQVFLKEFNPRVGADGSEQDYVRLFQIVEGHLTRVPDPESIFYYCRKLRDGRDQVEVHNTGIATSAKLIHDRGVDTER
jgi:hypothetical protein